MRGLRSRARFLCRQAFPADQGTGDSCGGTEPIAVFADTGQFAQHDAVVTLVHFTCPRAGDRILDASVESEDSSSGLVSREPIPAWLHTART